MTWQLASFGVLSAMLAVGFGWYERSRPPAKVLALVAALAALATVGRIAFAPIPNVKPTTDIAVFAGFALGPVPGFAVGAVAALASNVFFGQGPWTPWQMFAWGLTGVIGGVAARVFGRELGRWPLAAICAFAGALFGVIMDGYQWTQSGTQDLTSYLAISATSLPYNLAHVIGNVGFCLLLGPTFVGSLRRYRRRFEVRWAAPATVAGLLAAVVLVALAPPAHAASPAARAIAYLRGAQNSDGGFGGAPGQSSNQLHTGWAALGFAAAGVNPADAQTGGTSVLGYLQAHSGSLSDVGDIERTILVLRSAGVSPRSFNGRDLVADLLKRRKSNGSWHNNVTHTSFGIFALKAAGGASLGSSPKWLARQQNRDGGFGFAPRAASTTDDTSAAVQALVASGRGGSKTVQRAVAFLRGSQNSDGGFPLMRQEDSNSQSTAWAVQGLVAAGTNPDAVKRHGRTPLGYIRSLQRPDGSISYSRTSRQTPVWTTAQALDALVRKPFPLRAAARKKTGAPKRKSRAPAAHKRSPHVRAGVETGEGRAPVSAPAPQVAKTVTPAAAAARTAVTQPQADSGGGFAWPAAIAAGSIAAVAAFALWRLAARRARLQR